MKTSLTPLLGLEFGGITAVTGCGGKTTIINLLAHENRQKRVLISPTTKIWPIREPDVFLCESEYACLSHIPQAGIQCFGELNPKTGKLHAFSPETLNQLTKKYDLSLLEADGSNCRPLKGYLTHEPVIPAYCTHTLGVLPATAVGSFATEEYVHRLPEFLKQTGLNEGAIVPAEAIIPLIDFMFMGALGKRTVIINQADVCEANAEALAENIARNFDIKIIIGSATQRKWKEYAA
ncbi:putative selenium-dependent hydroxylase accessory protein YqeC [Eubacteriales bacterium OttesenSCG-928-K08]|nr:putative selenium-dependent hydroxylase accessory protein YqeC [Eubacteriales bacterium OttesenSCG-928-K08]